MPESGLMRGKRGLIMGVANNRSIAWGIAKAARLHGADLAFTYQGDALRKRVEPLAEEVDGLVVGHCDVSDDASLDAAFAAVKSAWGSLDFVLHAIALFAHREPRHEKLLRQRRQQHPTRLADLDLLVVVVEVHHLGHGARRASGVLAGDDRVVAR